MPWARYSVEQWLRLYTVLIVAAAVGSLSIAAYQGQTLLYKPFLRFSDFTVYLEKTKHPFSNGEVIVAKPPELNYPAPAVLVYSIFANLPGDPLSWFVSVIVLAAVAGMMVIERILSYAGISGRTRWPLVLATLFTSYPLWFELDRANIEGVLWIFTLIGMYFFARGRFLLSGVSIALAATIKPFPLIVFFIFIAHSFYKELLLSLFVWVTVTISAFFVTSGTLAATFTHYQTGTSRYQSAIAVGYKAFESNYDHALFCVLKQLCRITLGLPQEPLGRVLGAMYLPYMALAACLALGCCYFLLRRPLINQILGLFMLMVLLPPSNYDYTLLNLYIPFAFFVGFLTTEIVRDASLIPNWVIGALLFCFAILFTAQTFVHLNQIGFGGQIKASALIGALVIALAFPMPAAAWDWPRANMRRQT